MRVPIRFSLGKRRDSSAGLGASDFPADASGEDGLDSCPHEIWRRRSERHNIANGRRMTQAYLIGPGKQSNALRTLLTRRVPP